jgi:diguanylate cyclase (GGDEF)-like protein/PAS domain S-box-containing protein
MLDQFLLGFSGENSWMPHGFCIQWTPSILWTYVISDALIALTYYFIPCALAYFAYRRKDLQFRGIFLMFSAFILACGTTHLFSVVLLWQPLYWIDATLKAITAALSITTAICLVRLIPLFLNLPSPAELEQEIEQRKKSELDLQKSESNLRLLTKQLYTLIEAIPDAILLKDGEGRLLITNKIAKQLFNLNDIVWQGKTSLELVIVCPSMRNLHEKCFIDDESAWSSRSLHVSEQPIRDIAGNYREFEMRKSPLFENNGERKGLVVIGRDITERKLFEHDLRIAAIAIEAQEGIMITDANNCILRINRAFTRLTGYSPVEVIGKTPAILKSNRHDDAFYHAMWEKLIPEKYWQGEVWDRRKNGEVYPKWLTITAVTDPLGSVTNYVGAFTDLSEHKDAEAAIHRLAYYDPLTDLPNRRLLTDRLELAVTMSARNSLHAAILMIDLDNFKTINDTKGHGVGDQLLGDVAKRLKACVRQGDTLARLGGDEFVILLEDLNNNEGKAAIQAQGVGEKVLKVINQPYLLEGHKLHSSASIGISLFSGATLTGEELLKHADTAMYEAKHAGRNTLCFFDPVMQTLLETRVTLESALRNALPDEELHLYYQLQVDNKRHVLGAEVLLRWKHPQLGIISPTDFIPIAEETGLILSIGDWVLRTACLQLKAWDNSPLTQDLQLAVNVSARQFSQPNFVKEVCKILVQTGANAKLLKMELTESLVMHNVAETIEKMETLKLLGIQFSMDDFGTGYSSLSYLKKLPLFQLKIDQSFVRDLMIDPSDAAIIQTIIGMAHNLKLNVIAEGVETEEQCVCLERLGCHTYQGYLFSKPIPLVEFEKLLSERAIHEFSQYSTIEHGLEPKVQSIRS